ncbi:Glyoxalase/bleomycin resistance protein/dioxygenase [Paenibacillus vortex V453]|uniref:Glyoxalase n=2 Tax=Paenibacillus TaxID=44249 RepID=A0A163FQX6_9BACL|nr:MULTISPECIES: VOC family protein [Paenibacillus]AWP26109.1 glyoxalase/bleomycin resistance/dioxygenase family protein [Paenibacillus sp. Cedars]EFU38841.1 Glyoxalase/bleomycin resistance protein/dioxygenase [Paenibacillus vortex V453]KZS44521.1 glyoxalase [Paenibacillus glucanolyticus]MDH6674595.1 lactoylglutathione lyase [Paenibacillus sp. LBL]OMF78131.1 glyoxalase [Paenibacillus glucanolyticus]
MPNLCVLSINVSNMDQAKQFYCDILGFQISKAYSEEIISLENEGLSLVLQKCDRITKTDYPHEAQVIIGIETADVSAAISKYKSQGVEVIFDTPQPCPPGLYSAIRDPFGNVIELLEFTE